MMSLDPNARPQRTIEAPLPQVRTEGKKVRRGIRHRLTTWLRETGRKLTPWGTWVRE